MCTYAQFQVALRQLHTEGERERERDRAREQARERKRREKEKATLVTASPRALRRTGAKLLPATLVFGRRFSREAAVAHREGVKEGRRRR